MGDENEYTMGELIRAVGRIEKAVEDVKNDMRGLSAGFVPRGEYVEWRKAVEGKLSELLAARAPWWTWASVLIAAASLAFALLK